MGGGNFEVKWDSSACGEKLQVGQKTFFTWGDSYPSRVIRKQKMILNQHSLRWIWVIVNLTVDVLHKCSVSSYQQG